MRVGDKDTRHLQNIMFKGSAIDIIIGWVSIHKLVNEEGVEWEPPILWARAEPAIFPCTEIIELVDRCLVLIEVVSEIFWIIPQCGRRGTMQP
jgi:hypothetical protein